MQLDSTTSIARPDQTAVIAGLETGRLRLDSFDEFGPLGRDLCGRAEAPLALERLLADSGRRLVGYVPAEDLL